MNLKTTFYGVMLFFTAVSAHALDMRSAQPVASAPEAQTGARADLSGLSNARIRQVVGQAGFDPDSGKGRLLVKLATRIATDPAFRDKFSKWSQRGGMFGGQFSADDRLRVLHLLKGMTQGPTNDCAALAANGRDFFQVARTLSTQGLQNLLEILEISIDRSMPDSNGEQYTTAQLLDADAELESRMPAQFGATGAPNGCEVIRVAVDAIEGLPPASQQPATYEVFQIIDQKKPARAKVLADPFAYLDDMFDERRMPDAIRRKLPENGSRPLPFSRLVIDAEWKKPSAPDQPTPFRDTFINRRNNGVIAEVVTPPSDSARPAWSDFYLSYGVASLLTQSIGTGELTPLGTLKTDAALETASRPLLEGRSIELALPLPAENGETSRTCEIGKTVPASTLASSLEGDAVGLHCHSVTKRGDTVSFDAALLVKYGITWTTSIDNEHGRTDVAIRNVTIQQP